MITNIETLPTEITNYSIDTIAGIIQRDWKKVYFGAVPYLNAMFSLNSINDNYGLDSGKSIVTYFLCNCNTWKGDVARIVKAELKKRIK